MSKPLYGCSNPSCAEEVSYPAVMLRVYEGKPYCDCCWDDAPLAYAPGVDPDDEDAEPLYWHDLEPFVPEHEKRIAELEAEEQLFNKTFDAQQVIIEELRADNQRLRDAAQAVVDSATPHYDRWVNGVTRICINRLKALLGGGENG